MKSWQLSKIKTTLNISLHRGINNFSKKTTTTTKDLFFKVRRISEILKKIDFYLNETRTDVGSGMQLDYKNNPKKRNSDFLWHSPYFSRGESMV